MVMWNWMARQHSVLPIGVDIGHSGIKMVQLAHVDDDVRVLSVERAAVTLPTSADDRQRRDTIVSAIRQSLSRGHFTGRKAVSVLSGDDLQVTSLRLTEVESAQAEKVLRREAAQRFNLDVDNDAIQYLPAGSIHQDDEVKNEFIVLAAKAAAVEDRISLLEEAGLLPAGLDAAPCALFRSFERAMRREEDKLRTVLFLDVGQRYTTVVFGRSGEICLAKQIPFGTARFDEEIASKLEVTQVEAESLRRRIQRGESVEDGTRHLVTDALVAAAEQLARELSLCLRYHTVTFRGKRVERAVVAGGGAYESELLEILQRHLSIEVAPAEPLRGMEVADTLSGDEQDRASADLAIAIGLSLKGRAAALAAPEPPEASSETVLEGERS
jgi:type IV pilus assembly protein PilM